MRALVRTELGLPNRREGKVRDIYDLPNALKTPAHDRPAGAGRHGRNQGREGGGHGGGKGEGSGGGVLLVATDRISAFDVVMPTGVPGKGALLTEIAARWFGLIRRQGLVETHLVSTDPADAPGLTDEERSLVAGRVMIGRRCRIVPVECVVRGYLDGSGWRAYRETGRVCGVELPGGLERGARLDAPIFTPATKAAGGDHDENITFDEACAHAESALRGLEWGERARGGGVSGAALMQTLRDRSLALYAMAHEYAALRGLILADTKFEFGLPVDASGAVVERDPILCDEVLTPDSSRYWPESDWRPGGEQTSFDKQYVREYLQGLVDRGEWDKRDPGPELPARVVEGTAGRYREARDRLFGRA